MIVRTLGTALLTFSMSWGLGTAAALSEPFAPPPDRSAPRSTAGGGSRPAAGSCTLDKPSGLQAMAMAPQTFVGLTHQSTPNLWLYLPNNEVSVIEISLFNQQLSGLVQFELSRPDSAGLISVDISEHFALSAGVPYYWTAAFICDPGRRTEDWVVGGWIQHEPNASDNQQARQVLALADQINQYASSGYWYDAFAAMLSLSQTSASASELQANWNHLAQQATIELTWTDLNNASTRPFQ